MTLRIHELAGDPGKRQRRKRVGRGEGSGRGRTAGRGNKGAQARSGYRRRLHSEGGQTPLVRRLPKHGFRNTAFRVEREELTLEKLNRFAEGSTVDLDALRREGLVSKGVRRVKVIATGELGRALTVKLHGFSQGARAAIEARGGTCEVVEP
jgi:large subunit ribosomal protein L15